MATAPTVTRIGVGQSLVPGTVREMPLIMRGQEILSISGKEVSSKSLVEEDFFAVGLDKGVCVCIMECTLAKSDMPS